MSRNSFTDVLKRYFVSGMLVVVPVILTYFVLRFLFDTVDGVLEPVLHDILGYYRTGLGVLTTILVILLAGVLTRNYLGARIYRMSDKLLNAVPIIRPIYSASKQLLEAVTQTGANSSFREVALIEHPRKGLYAMCFVSKRFNLQVDGRELPYVVCFVASTPTPVSGFVVMVPADELIALDMTVEDGVKFLVSGGVASSSLIQRRPAATTTKGGDDTHEAG
ncbi:DUF502 domain-containing protein [candidate division GN15 bacterium]|nr:DUF502 domain-containing protein [candidate division GN15 bacterium]